MAADINDPALPGATVFDLAAILWTGNDWSQLGLNPVSQSIAPAIPNLGLMSPSMVLDSEGQLLMVWSQNTSVDENDVPIVGPFGFPLRSEIYVRRSSAGTPGNVGWFELGTGSATDQGISAGVGLSITSVMTIQKINNRDWAVVAWQDEAGAAVLRPLQTPQIYVRRALLPLIAPSTFHIVSINLVPAGVAINWGSDEGSIYLVQRSPDLSPGSWITVMPATAGTGNSMNFTDDADIQGSQFYRVIATSD